MKILGFNVSRIVDDVPLYRELYDKKAIEEKRFYNVGAGSFKHPCWTNVDHKSDWYAEEQGKGFLEWDLLSYTPIPVEDGCAEIVYSSHTIEHVTDKAANNFFREAYRILKPRGTLRITCPDVDLAYRAYLDRDEKLLLPSIEQTDYKTLGLGLPFEIISSEQLFLLFFASVTSTAHVADVEKITDVELSDWIRFSGFEKTLNYCISKCSIELQRKFPGCHMNWWNYRKLSGMLVKAGFKPHISAYGQSFAVVLRNTWFFDGTHPEISLYVEASK